MSSVFLDAPSPSRTSSWKWWICGLLLMATMINYMDRLTLNQAATRIKEELQLNNEEYGDIEYGFGVAFAVGALFMGRAADRWNLRWVFPLVLLGWSAAGFATGFSQTLGQLIVCRVALGFFESGLWPCGLRTTQHILRPDERTMGNSLLQSGAAVGAIITPLIVLLLVDEPGTWPRPFFVIGLAGTGWVVLWLLSVRTGDLASPRTQSEKSVREREAAIHTRWIAAIVAELRWLAQLCGQRRFWALVVIVTAINMTWHFFRVWLPSFLHDHHEYSEHAVQGFSTAYYVATDAGSLSAGFAALWLARNGWSIHGSRVLVFSICCGLTLLSFAVAYVQPGFLLLALLLLLGFGALGLFPVYYSFSQELTVKDQGKLTGLLSFITWMVSARMHPFVGQWLDRTKDWPHALALAGLPPLVGLIFLLLLWGRNSSAVAAVPGGSGRAGTVADGLASEPVPELTDRIQTS